MHWMINNLRKHFSIHICFKILQNQIIENRYV